MRWGGGWGGPGATWDEPLSRRAPNGRLRPRPQSPMLLVSDAQVWHHRQWVMGWGGCAWQHPVDLKLTAKLLVLDDRNFHCWIYRRFAPAARPTQSALGLAPGPRAQASRPEPPTQASLSCLSHQTSPRLYPHPHLPCLHPAFHPACTCLHPAFHPAITLLSPCLHPACTLPSPRSPRPPRSLRKPSCSSLWTRSAPPALPLALAPPHFLPVPAPLALALPLTRYSDPIPCP